MMIPTRRSSYIFEETARSAHYIRAPHLNLLLRIEVVAGRLLTTSPFSRDNQAI